MCRELDAQRWFNLSNGGHVDDPSDVDTTSEDFIKTYYGDIVRGQDPRFE